LSNLQEEEMLGGKELILKESDVMIKSFGN
jgi:hypothetical protein